MVNNKEVLYLGIGLVVGGVVGYLAAKKRLEAVYDERADSEIAEVKEHYKILHKKEYSEPKDYIADKYGDALASLGYTTEEERLKVAEGLDKLMSGGVDTDTYIQNAFDLDDKDVGEEITTSRSRTHGDPMKDPEWLKSVENRDTSKPYIISEEEFSLENRHFDKVTLGYFVEDDTLVDDQDRPIDDAERSIGSDALMNFGLYSGDPNIVFVRNEQVSIDYEVVRDERSYQEVILGIRERSVSQKFPEDD